MMQTTNLCVFCDKECKSSDSRPHPNTKSKLRIHNKCLIKKSLADKTKQNSNKEKPTNIVAADETKGAQLSQNWLKRMTEHQSNVKKAESDKHLAELEKRTQAEPTNSSSFFFDLKAGIAKPHEKRRFLHHRKLTEMTARYDDSGFQKEAIGRAYDTSGKDLNTLDDEEEESDDDDEVQDTGNQPTNELNLLNGDEREAKAVKRPRLTVNEQNPCWFCLSSPMVEKHLIIAIGDYCYLALAKGGLTEDHMLIAPIEHIQSLNCNAMTDDIILELNKFKNSLIRYYSTQTKGVVFFERNFRSVHWQLHAVPMPLDCLGDLEDNIKTLSTTHFKNSSYIDIPVTCSLRDMMPTDVAYFYWHIEPTQSQFVTQIQTKGSFFPIQLARVILSDPKILNCPDRIDWKSCTKSKAEYIELVKDIKQGYAKFSID